MTTPTHKAPELVWYRCKDAKAQAWPENAVVLYRNKGTTVPAGSYLQHLAFSSDDMEYALIEIPSPPHKYPSELAVEEIMEDIYNRAGFFDRHGASKRWVAIIEKHMGSGK